MSQISLFNTMSRQKEKFKPLNPKEVTLYTCGPTVYQSPTVGNWRTYIFEDVLKRTLEYKGFKVKHVMNITDVGHLTSDADEGEDKLEKAAKKEQKKAQDIANYYFKEFKSNLKKLNIKPPSSFIRAADIEEIQKQIDLILILEKKGFTYKTSDGIYFNTNKIPKFVEYQKLSGKDRRNLQDESRIKVNLEKKNKTDFALWKFSPKNEKRDMEWDSPWGIGFPGWHIECSSIATSRLGKSIDIHCGAIDLIPTHHTNEIIQSESAYRKKAQDPPFVRYWLHGEFLLIDGGRMGKSLGNAYTLDDVVEKGFSPLDLRYFFFSAHYRQKLNFTWGALEVSRKTLNRIRGHLTYFKSLNKSKKNSVKLNAQAKKIVDEFNEAIYDDLNIPKAIAILHSVVNPTERGWSGDKIKFIGQRPNHRIMALLEDDQALEVIEQMDQIFGLDLLDLTKLGEPQKTEIPEKIQKLIDEREKARKEESWEKADLLRKTIEQQGYLIRDLKDSSKLIIK